MKKILIFFIVIFFFSSITAYADFKPFYVYTEAGSKDNHYIPSGWMGDYDHITIDINDTGLPYRGESCIKIKYTPNGSLGAKWAGIYWQSPANNWGGKDGGFDLTGAAKLTFWAKGEKGGEIIDEFKYGGILGKYKDSGSSSIGPVKLTKKWKQYSIDLTDKDISYIIGGFCCVFTSAANPDGAIFYLDEIRYE